MIVTITMIIANDAGGKSEKPIVEVLEMGAGMLLAVGETNVTATMTAIVR